jgi:hypothetical protein
VRYFEVRLDPQKLATEDITMEAVVQAVLTGLKGKMYVFFYTYLA